MVAELGRRDRLDLLGDPLLELKVVRRQLHLQPLQAQVRLDAREHLLLLERLGDVVDAAGAKGLDLLVGPLDAR